jgi:hypothetical protein
MRNLRRRPSEFEIQLSGARPRPSDDFRAALTEAIASQRSRRVTRARLALAGVMTAVLLVAFSAAGGLGDAAASVTGAIEAVTNLATASQPQQVNNSPADDQYRPGKGCGDKNHIHPRQVECKMSINDVNVKEGNVGTTNASFVVSLNGSPIDPVSASYATGLTVGTATAGVDYVPVSGTLVFAPGETSKTIPVLVNGDVFPEPNETFFVTLFNPSANVTTTDNLGRGTILNDD